MSTQISLQRSEKMIKAAKKHANKHGYDTVQDFIRETMRERLFDEKFTGLQTAIASEPSLARDWLSDAEEKAWAHLQKEKSS